MRTHMKKLITLMLGMTIVLGTTALFAGSAEDTSTSGTKKEPLNSREKKASKTHKTKTKKTRAATPAAEPEHKAQQ